MNIPLVENGENIVVSDANKSEYVRLLANHRMTTAIRKQVTHLMVIRQLSITSIFLSI